MGATSTSVRRWLRWLRLLRRIPTSLLVTLLGIALTAWLLPAFTRQWDDRQKARDLKAALAADLGDATAHAMIRTRQALRRVTAEQTRLVAVPDLIAQNNAETKAAAELSDAWQLDSIKIEAMFRAYFKGQPVLRRLHAYDDTMRALFVVAALAPAGLKVERGEKGLRALARVLGVRFSTFRDDLRSLKVLRRGDLRSYWNNPDIAFDDLSSGVLSRERALISGILQAHVDGYSTTTHDLLHDLIP